MSPAYGSATGVLCVVIGGVIELELPFITVLPAVAIAAALMTTPPLNRIESLDVELLANEHWFRVRLAFPEFLRSCPLVFSAIMQVGEKTKPATARTLIVVPV